jgi:hypothetical protein
VREVEVRFQPAWHEDCTWQVASMSLDFLHAHAIGLLSREPAEEAFRHRRPESVEIQGNDA